MKKTQYEQEVRRLSKAADQSAARMREIVKELGGIEGSKPFISGTPLTWYYKIGKDKNSLSGFSVPVPERHHNELDALQEIENKYDQKINENPNFLEFEDDDNYLDDKAIPKTDTTREKFKRALTDTFKNKTGLDPNDYDLDKNLEGWYKEFCEADQSAGDIVSDYIIKHDLDDLEFWEGNNVTEWEFNENGDNEPMTAKELRGRLDKIEKLLSVGGNTVNAEQEESEIIDRTELCKRLNISRPTAMTWEKKGKIPALRMGKAIRYNWPSVLESLNNKQK